MKKLQDYLNSLDKTKEEFLYLGGGASDIVREVIYLDEYLEPEDIPELKSYWAFSWICTDTRVGLRLFYLNEKFICASFQPARKSDESFCWVSAETRKEFKDYIISKLKYPNDREFELIDWNEDLSPIEKHNEFRI